MKIKKILAAIAACAMSAAMLGVTVYAAPAEGDTDIIGEEGDVIGEEEGGEEEGDVVGEEEGDGEEESKADVQEEQKSPVTGNAPIALAVIPVALAAAAVVAKKAE